MPELPEVETVTNALRPHLINKSIRTIAASDKKLRFPLDISQCRIPDDCRITDVKRRAKYILIELENLTIFVMHLGMSGNIRIENSKFIRKNHDHFFIHLKNGTSMIFNDPRRFGSIRLFTIDKPNQLPIFLNGLPPEPLSNTFDENYFSTLLKFRTKSIKSILMDSKLVTGVGNIYACEALFRANINPQKSGAKLSKKQRNKLLKAIKKVLIDSIESGGTTISDFRKVDGTEGMYSLKLNVYGREQQPCINECGSTIKRIKMGGRSTYHCPICQKS